MKGNAKLAYVPMFPNNCTVLHEESRRNIEVSFTLGGRGYCATHSASQGEVSALGVICFCPQGVISTGVTLVASASLQCSFELSNVERRKSCSPGRTEDVNEQGAVVFRLLKVLYVQYALSDFLSTAD